MSDRTEHDPNATADAGEAALRNELAALPRAIRPERDQWQQISRRIAAEKTARETARAAGVERDRDFAGRSWRAVAASVLLVAVGGLFITQMPGNSEPAHQPVAEVSQEQPEGVVAGAEASAPLPTSLAELEYQAAFREFVRLDLSQSAVSANAREAILQDWTAMRELEQDLLAAMEQEPDNALLQDRWIHLRSSQLQLLHVIAETGQRPGRTPI